MSGNYEVACPPHSSGRTEVWVMERSDYPDEDTGRCVLSFICSTSSLEDAEYIIEALNAVRAQNERWHMNHELSMTGEWT